MNEDHPSGRKKLWVIAGELTAVAFEFVGSVVVGVVVGYFADRQFDTEPWLLIAFTLFGTSAGFYQMVRILMHFEKHE
jgi:ATP synthase protein I